MGTVFVSVTQFCRGIRVCLEDIPMNFRTQCVVSFASILIPTALGACGSDSSSPVQSEPISADPQPQATHEAPIVEVKASDAASEAPVQRCAIQMGVVACDECIQNSCRAQCDKCAANRECKAIWDCIYGTCISDAGVVNESCAKKCAISHLGGVGDFGSFFQALQPGCVMTKCKAECSAP